MSAPRLSVLVRCRDEERGIGPLLDGLRAQEVAVEIVVVDSGSRDRTLQEVGARGLTPIEIPPERFTYGRALNIAAAAASGDLCVAISAHALPGDPGWAGRMLGAFEDERVACAFGERRTPDLDPLEEPILQDLDHARRNPFYGYSNSAGGFRRALWEDRPFREEMSATEDKEWAWHWLERGMLVRLDPALAVHHDHRDEGTLRTFRRARADFGEYRRFRTDLPRVTLIEALAEWWRGPHAHRSALRARVDPRRVAMLAGKWAALRGGRNPA